MPSLLNCENVERFQDVDRQERGAETSPQIVTRMKTRIGILDNLQKYWYFFPLWQILFLIVDLVASTIGVRFSVVEMIWWWNFENSSFLFFHFISFLPFQIIITFPFIQNREFSTSKNKLCCVRKWCSNLLGSLNIFWLLPQLPDSNYLEITTWTQLH